MKKLPASGSVIINLVLITAILFILNLFLSGYFVRLDLTKEKRYTLSELTQNTADSLNGILTVKIYLEGDFHPMIKRYRDAIKTTLLEMKARSGKYLHYQFIDPSKDKELQKSLVQRGVRPVPVRYKGNNNEISEKWIFPAAVITYQGKEQLIDLLQSDCAVNQKGVECDYQKAESEIEYKLVSNIRKLFRVRKPIIGFLQGHGEYRADQMQEWIAELRKFYEVVAVNSKDGEPIPPSKRNYATSIQDRVDGEGIDVLVIAQPDSALTEREKYIIDQFIMLGGRVLWMFDQTRVDEKDFQTELAATLTESRRLNLDDMTQKYGFKVNYDLIQDDIAGVKAVTTSMDGKTRIIPMKWTYFPMIFNFPTDKDNNKELLVHPVARSINAVLTRYASSVQTLKNDGVQIRTIMTSSEFSRSQSNPFMIELDQTISRPPPKKIYEGKGYQPLAVSLEGNFSSVFAGRTLPKNETSPKDSTEKGKPIKSHFFDKSTVPTRMIVIGDGAIALANHEPRLGGLQMPADNKPFLMNCLEWLINDDSYTEMRAKRAPIYALSGKKVQGNENVIRIVNIVLPVLLSFGLGICLFLIRKRRNAKRL